MVFLSAFTTKTAVYVLLRGFPGAELLIYLGLFMVFYGIIYAILENDMRRILAYSIVNQVGLHGDGHRHRHGDGAQRHRRARLHAHHLQGAAADVGRLGALHDGQAQMHRSRRPVPHHAAHHALRHRRRAVDLVFPADFGLRLEVDDLRRRGPAASRRRLVSCSPPASAGVFLHAGIKFPWFVFFQKDSGLRPAEPPWNMRARHAAFAGALHRPSASRPVRFTRCCRSRSSSCPTPASHVVFQLQLLLFSGLAFFLMLGWLKRTLTITLDIDWF